MTFQDPAEQFLANHKVTSKGDVITYTNYLRQEAGLDASPPTDLEVIYGHFNIPLPQKASLPNQEGLTIFDGRAPQILVNEDDPASRQRYTEAHELIEFLFHKLPGDFRMDRVKQNVFGKKKETICQAGAAHLLMPEKSYSFYCQKWGLSLNTGKRLADLFQVSLMAALFRMADLHKGWAAVILWCMKNKPVELENEVPSQQLSFLANPPAALPPPKLRVEWSYGEYKNAFIPKDKSIPEDSSVYQAWQNKQNTSSEELLPFGKGVKGYLENLPLAFGGERYILTLLSAEG